MFHQKTGFSQQVIFDVWSIESHVGRPLANVNTLRKSVGGQFDDFEVVLFFIISISLLVVKKRPLKHRHNKLSKIDICQNVFHILDDIFSEMVFRYCLKGSFLRKKKKTVSVFPGIQTEELQPRRQARSRPGEKETLNICRGKNENEDLPSIGKINRKVMKMSSERFLCARQDPNNNRNI